MTAALFATPKIMSANSATHDDTIDRIYEETGDELWTMPYATLVLLLFGILGMTLLVNVVFYSFAHWTLAVLVYAVEIAVPAYVLYRHRQKVDAAVRAKVSALEATHPGITDAFARRRKKKQP